VRTALLVSLMLSCALARAAPPTQYSADSLYNLGNSYARSGQLGLAVLNYERAALLTPGDADIRANLEYVRARANVASKPRSGFELIAQGVNPTWAAWLGVIGIGLIGAAALAQRVTPQLRWVNACGLALGVALVALSVSNAMLLWPRLHDAVVLVNKTPARVSPVPMGDTAFVLPEAETVAIAAVYCNFVLVRTADGDSGWVARANLGVVAP
jgi:tetratricopeptide (TPR) repeat protein